MKSNADGGAILKINQKPLACEHRNCRRRHTEKEKERERERNIYKAIWLSASI
jgi:hypothetical protein